MERPGVTERASLEKVNPGHRGQKKALQVIGLSLLAVGGLLAVIGFASFASSFGSAEAGIPRGFWLLFVGVPMASIGFALVKFGFLGEIGRYGAGELAPVARDALDYLEAGGEAAVKCPSCGQENEAGSNFCDSCGAALTASAPPTP